ncbi:MAG: hypothetical protein ACXVX9_05975 [Mycobacteriaceae bacterium]
MNNCAAPVYSRDPVRPFDATPMIGESTRKAYEAAQAWVVQSGQPLGAASVIRSGG